MDTVDGLREFVKEIIDSIGIEDGYLSRLGLIPLSSEDIKKASAKVYDIT